MELTTRSKPFLGDVWKAICSFANRTEYFGIKTLEVDLIPVIRALENRKFLVSTDAEDEILVHLFGAQIDQNDQSKPIFYCITPDKHV